MNSMTVFPTRPVLVVIGVAFLPLAAISAAARMLGVDVMYLTRDTAAIAGIHPLAGILSNAGILLWWASAAIWFFTAAFHRRMKSDDPFLFSLCSGLASAYLALDDLLQIHEFLAPTYLRVPEEGVYGALAMGAVVYAWRFRQFLLRADACLLLLAGFLLAGSVGIDAVLEPWLWRLGNWTGLLEDGLKWMGIICWLSFCLLRCFTEICKNTETPASS
jgi:hypothetical protein